MYNYVDFKKRKTTGRSSIVFYTKKLSGSFFLHWLMRNTLNIIKGSVANRDVASKHIEGGKQR